MATPRSSRFLTASAGLLMVALLAACTGLPKVAPSYAVHDFGGPEPVAARSLGFPLRNVEVVVPPWLASTAMQYRLAYAQATRRQAYVESRWAAQPAQLVELALKRAIRTGEAGAGGACRLRVELDEFAQVFDGEAVSRGVVEARAVLLAPRTDQLVASRSFSLARPAPSADALGGVSALRGGVQELGSELFGWLDGLDREGAARTGGSLRSRCGA